MDTNKHELAVKKSGEPGRLFVPRRLRLTWKPALFILHLLFLPFTATASFLDVTDFGARGDAETDDTAAFQEAMDAAAAAGGGVVRVPAGNYRIESTLNIPDLVTLEGTWRAPGRLYLKNGDNPLTGLRGSVLLAYAGAGDEEGDPFIWLNSNSTLKGIAVFYPEQTRTNPPVEYPWTVASAGADNCSIVDVLLINPYQAVDFGTRVAGRHLIRNLYAQPLRRGLFVDQCYDIGRVENVHFWPFWTDTPGPVWDFMHEHGEAFLFGRTDWQYLTNCFSIGYGVGYRFGDFGHGPGNVLMTQSGADEGPVAMLVENTQFHAGVSVSNSQMFGAIVVEETNQGPVRFTSCGFFGSSVGDLGFAHARLDGIGQVSFNNCHFLAIHPDNTEPLAIHVKGGGVSIVGSDFMDAGREHVRLEKDVDSAVITSNRFRGRMNITDRMDRQAVIALNTDGTRREEKGAIVVAPTDKKFFETEGRWVRGYTGKEYLGTMYWAPHDEEVATATWTPELPEEGRYQVSMWWGADHHDDRATNALVRIRHRDGVEEIRIDQTQNVGEWVSLGEFRFDAGREGSVKISTEGADNIPLADSVKFVLEEEKKERN